ncbi:prenyltransferase/squalene oxidase repeat-containing protein [Agaribacterium haliotis]|uniref:prenyltransferase/squalene oxidase repeat-containing protein n=1 Tax=Agaribacterium haliotis TaxID=2013869 RepID=UPI000BB582E4|nr:prenyltransferase/squalene oxidase repeat-containing protein [Agaribacterium haliotis]
MTEATAEQIQRSLYKAYNYIKSCQLESGAVPWFAGAKLDPWDHCEALMALSIYKDWQAVERGFLWLEQQQNPDGSWYACYLGDNNLEFGSGGNKQDRLKIETNFVAYAATALWHFWLCSGNTEQASRFFPMIARAINFVCKQQSSEGDIQWALSSCEKLNKDALLTACSSILRSLECAIYLAELLKQPYQDWLQSYRQLKETIRNKPWRFDRSWPSKERFSMDWFYPVLSGALSAQEAKLRLTQSWDKFVHSDYGCRCVSDEPWITVAESSELVIALVAAEQHSKAETLLRQLLRWQDGDGGFWTGYQFQSRQIWPREKPSWTSAAVILAADALWALSPANKLFTTTNALFAAQHS